MESLTFGSLFAGIGGLDLGLERAGMVCKWQVEIDDYASMVLAKHWPNVPRFKDIKEFPPKKQNNLSVDLVCGGFPCQDISYAGKGAGLDGERSGLFYELIRVVREVGPKYVLLENVSALFNRGLDQVLGTLASIGYDAEWHCISAAHIGAPHIRDRVFILAHTQGERHRQGGELGDIPHTMREGLEGQRQKLFGVSPQHYYAGNNSHWAIEPSVDRMAYGVSKRVDRLRGLGNAVVPQVAEYIGCQIIERFCES